ncbi:MAG: DUF1934 family protein [Solobacterium sp.]|nr:DUF1934 family protein [Solobacterium sp.]
MKIHIKLIQYDQLSHTSTVLADDLGDICQGKLTYRENSSDHITHEILYGQGHFVLKRISDLISETDLILKEKSFARVLSPYGVMMLETYMDRCELSEKRWEIEYHILQEDVPVTHQILIWEFGE